MNGGIFPIDRTGTVGFVVIVRRHQPKVGVEALFRRQIVRQMAQMPFADHRGRITLGLEDFGNGDFRRWKPAQRSLAENPWPRCHCPAAHRMPARHQRRAAGRADRGSTIETRPALALGRHSVKMRRRDGRVSVTAQIAVPQIVGEDDDNIRRLPTVRGRCQKQG